MEVKRVVTTENLKKFCGHFCKNFWPIGHFFVTVATFVSIFDTREAEKRRFWPKKVANWPLLKMDLATKNRLFMRFFGILVKNPLFFLISCDKKNTIFIINSKKKWPIGQKLIFGQILRKS